MRYVYCALFQIDSVVSQCLPLVLYLKVHISEYGLRDNLVKQNVKYNTDFKGEVHCDI